MTTNAQQAASSWAQRRSGTLAAAVELLAALRLDNRYQMAQGQSVATARGVGIELRVTDSFIETRRRAVANGSGEEDLSVVQTGDAA